MSAPLFADRIPWLYAPFGSGAIATYLSSERLLFSTQADPAIKCREQPLVGESRHSSKEFICSVRPSLNDRFRLEADVRVTENSNF